MPVILQGQDKAGTERGSERGRDIERQTETVTETEREKGRRERVSKENQLHQRKEKAALTVARDDLETVGSQFQREKAT